MSENIKKRSVTDAKKKSVAGKQHFKCANSPGSNITRIEDYECPLWKNHGEFRGCFDESGYDIDHIVEHSLTYNDSIKNLQALCKSCHSVKTKRFMIIDDGPKKRKDTISIEKSEDHKKNISCHLAYGDSFNADLELKKPELCSNVPDKLTKEGIQFKLCREEKKFCGLISEEKLVKNSLDRHELDLAINDELIKAKAEIIILKKVNEDFRQLISTIGKELTFSRAKIKGLEEENQELNEFYTSTKEKIADSLAESFKKGFSKGCAQTFWDSDFSEKYLDSVLDEIKETAKNYYDFFYTHEVPQIIEKLGSDDGKVEINSLESKINSVYLGITDETHRKFLTKKLRSNLSGLSAFDL